MDFFGVGRNCLSLFDAQLQLGNIFEKRRQNGKLGYDSPIFRIPVVLIFGHPDSEAIEQFRKRMKYYHHRSADFVELFAIGYYDPDQDDPNLIPMLDEIEFSKSVEALEELTNWKYSGQTDVIFLYYIRDETDSSSIRSEFDFSNAMSLTIEKAVETKLISSASDLLERIVRITRSESELDFVRALSADLTSGGMKFGFLSWLASVLKIDKAALRAVGMAAPSNLRR